MSGPQTDAGPIDAPTLTVVLPNYNHAGLLPRAIDALLAQDCPADEILVIDDGSTDNSVEIIQRYAGRVPAIRLLTNPANLGAIATPQRGLEAARGRYIYFAAADDWVWPGFFSRATRLLDSYPQGGFFCAEALLVDGDSGLFLGFRPIARPRYRQGQVPPAAAHRLLARIDNWILTGSAVFRRERVVEAGGFDRRFGSMADSYLARKIALKHGFCFAPVIVATWCISSHGLSRTASLCDAEQILEAVPPLIAADPDFPAWYAETFRRRWRFATARLALEQRPPVRALLRSMGARSALGGKAFDAVWALLPSPAAKLAVLIVLWLSFRPTSLGRVAATAIARRVDGTYRRAALGSKDAEERGTGLYRPSISPKSKGC